MKKNIDSHIPYVTGKEIYYLKKVLKKKKFSGRGFFSKECEKIISNNYKKHEVLLTTSCTDALEMAAILLNIKAGDEVILPSYTFVSTANAFVLRGAKLIFVDTYNSHPCIDASQIKKKITKKTKCICIIHYASISCDMNQIVRICKKYKIKLVEDCANAMGSFYKKKKLGLFGDLSTFSFHDTKNITSGEGGALLINNKEFVSRAKIILEKGTNRSDFLNIVKKYGIYKFCEDSRCNYESISKRQSGENNTCHKMTDESFKSMCSKNSIKMKQNIREGKFIPNVTNSWAKSRCEIEFYREDVLIKIKTRSTWDAYFQIFNPSFVYEKVVIPYKLNNVCYNYIVDFDLN